MVSVHKMLYFIEDFGLKSDISIYDQMIFNPLLKRMSNRNIMCCPIASINTLCIINHLHTINSRRVVENIHDRLQLLLRRMICYDGGVYH